MMENFNELSRILFDGPVKARDFKTLRGDNQTADRDVLAAHLLASMERVGIIREGSLVDINKAAAPAA